MTPEAVRRFGASNAEPLPISVATCFPALALGLHVENIYPNPPVDFYPISSNRVRIRPEWFEKFHVTEWNQLVELVDKLVPNVAPQVVDLTLNEDCLSYETAKRQFDKNGNAALPTDENYEEF